MPSAFLWHKQGGVVVDIDGPQIYLDSSVGAQDNMCFLHSDLPNSITPNIVCPPRVSNQTGVTGWSFFGSGLPTQLGMMDFKSSYVCELTANSGTPPSVGGGSINATYSRSGRSVTANINIIFGTGAQFTGSNWFASLPFLAATRGVGSIIITRGVFGIKAGACFVNSGSRRLTMISGDNPTALGFGVPWGWQEGDIISVSITYEV